MRTRIRDRLVTASVILAVLAGGTVARGHGGDTTLVHACVQSDGLIRIIDPTAECASDKGETALDWNRIGFLHLERVAPEALKEIDDDLRYIEDQLEAFDFSGCRRLLADNRKIISPREGMKLLECFSRQSRRAWERMTAIMKTMHDTVKNSISNIR